MEPDDNLLLYFLVLVLLVALSAFFAMSEIAIISLNDNKVRKLAEDGNKKAQILVRLIDEPSKFLATIQFGVTISGFFAAAFAGNAFAGKLVLGLRALRLDPSLLQAIALIVITLALTCVHLLLGTLVPKRIGMQYCERISLAVARPLMVISKIEKPFVFLLSSTTNGILRMIGIDPHQLPDQVTEEEIRMMIDVGEESGNIEEGEKDMINNIFEFDDRTAAEMMTHRTEMVALEVDTPLVETIERAVESGHSRIPVYEDDLDSIVGILYVKDLLALVPGAQDVAKFKLREHLRDPMYVFESTSGDTLLKEFQTKKIQLAIVVDEYGGTSGVVTMEDLLESIVGNIQDEYDDEEDEIAQVGDNLFEIDALADIEEVEKFFDIEIDEEEDDDFETIGGYIIHRLGYIPSDEDHPEVQVGNIQFTVLGMEERRIAKLRAEVFPAPEQAELQEEAPGSQAGA